MATTKTKTKAKTKADAAAAAAEARKGTRRAREYETIYILRSNVEPDEADRVARRVRDIIERLEGKLLKLDNWGRRRLAYPIGGSGRGVFVLLRYVGYEDVVAELERNLRLMDSTIRHQTIQLRSRVDLASVEVDPADVEFHRLDEAPEEEELTLAQRLGLEQTAPRPRSDQSEEAESGEPPAEGEATKGEATTSEAESQESAENESTEPKSAEA